LCEKIPMSTQRTLRSVHLASTVWFVVCMGYILVLALRQAGFNWWFVFSLSGHSALIVFLLVSIYLFAIYRGIGGIQIIAKEHPLTSTNYYMAFYVAAPFLGGLAGCFGMIGASSASQFRLGVTLGTLGTTFLVWVVVDPATGMLETLGPASRRHRAERLARIAAERETKRRNRDRLLAKVFRKEEADRAHWEGLLKPQAEKLADLLATDRGNFKQAEQEAVSIGAHAWQIGGLGCMRQLRNMALTVSERKGEHQPIIDYISLWWDGIGTWRNPSM